MRLGEHVVLGGGAAAVLAPWLGADGAATFWAASVLIDVDHHWDYVHRNGFRDWGARNMFRFHHHLGDNLHAPDMLALSLFHTAEWFALVGWATVWWRSPLLCAVLLGMVFHLALDLIRLAGKQTVLTRALSVVEYRVRRRRLIRRGLDPDRVFVAALEAVYRAGGAPRLAPFAGTAEPFSPRRPVPPFRRAWQIARGAVAAWTAREPVLGSPVRAERPVPPRADEP